MVITTDRLREWLGEIDWDIDAESLDNSVPLVEQGLDSLDMVTLFFFLEERLGIKIPDSEAAGLASLKDISNYLGSL